MIFAFFPLLDNFSHGHSECWVGARQTDISLLAISWACCASDAGNISISLHLGMLTAGTASSFLLGTRIIYDRKFLMECRNSPVAKTPPCDLPDIPGVTSPNVEELKIENNHVHNYEEKVGAGERCLVAK